MVAYLLANLAEINTILMAIYGLYKGYLKLKGK